MIKQKLLTICSFLVMTLLFFGCSSDSDSDNDNGDNGTQGPTDFPFEEIMNDEISYMMIFLEEYDEELEAYFMMYIIDDHEELSITIDGNEVELSGFANYYFAELDLVPGQSIAYELTIDETSSSGNLSVPEVMQGTFPESFDLESDYSINWSISSDPSLFVVYLDIELEDDWVDHGAIAQGNQRSYTFSSDLYAGLSEDDIWSVDTGVTALDYDMRNDMVFLAGFQIYHDYDFGGQFKSRLKESITNGEFEGELPSFLRRR